MTDKVTRIPEKRTQAAFDFAVTQYAVMLSEPTVDTGKITAWLLHNGTEFVGWRQMGKVIRTAQANLKAARDIQAAQASLAELEARTAEPATV